MYVNKPCHTYELEQSAHISHQRVRSHLQIYTYAYEHAHMNKSLPAREYGMSHRCMPNIKRAVLTYDQHVDVS